MMTDTFSKIEIMLTRKSRWRFVENLVLLMLLVALGVVVYWRVL